MEYPCDVCNMQIKPKSKCKHFKSINHRNLDKQKDIKLTNKSPNIDNIDKKFYIRINEYDEKYE